MWPRHTNANLRGYLRSTKQIEYYTHYARGHIKKCSCSQKLVFEHFYFSHLTKKFTDMQFSKIFVQQIKMLDNIYFVFFFAFKALLKSEVCLEILTKKWFNIAEAICFSIDNSVEKILKISDVVCKIPTKMLKNTKELPTICDFSTFPVGILQTALEFFKNSTRSLAGTQT